MKRKIKSSKFPLSRVLDYSIIVLVAVTVIWLVTLGIKINSGVAKTVSVPESYIRLQLLDAGAGQHIIDSLKTCLDGYIDDKIEIKIVDIASFEARKVDKSFIINRLNEETEAASFASLLGFREDDISQKTLDANFNHISVSLVAGLDAEKTILANLQKRSEEELH